MPEVLLSRPLLRSMGLDIDKHRAEVRDEFHNADLFHVEFSGTVEGGIPSSTNHPSRLSRVRLDRRGHAVESKEFHGEEYVNSDALSNTVMLIDDASGMIDHVPSALFYGDGLDDDPLQADDELDPGKDDTSTTTQARHDRVKDSIANSLPAHLHGELEAMMTE